MYAVQWLAHRVAFAGQLTVGLCDQGSVFGQRKLKEGIHSPASKNEKKEEEEKSKTKKRGEGRGEKQKEKKGRK